MAGPKKLGCRPIAETKAEFKQRLLQFGDGKGAERNHRGKFQ